MTTFDDLPFDLRILIFRHMVQQRKMARITIAKTLHAMIYYACYRKHPHVIADLNWKLNSNIDWLLTYPGVRWQLKHTPYEFNEGINVMTHSNIISNINYGDYDKYC